MRQDFIEDDEEIERGLQKRLRRLERNSKK